METYYERNKEKIKARSKAYYEANKESHIAGCKRRRQENPEKFQVYRKKWESKSPTYIMCHNAKRRARDAGLDFNLDWREIQIPEYCPVLGVKLNDGTHESAASCDRLIPSLGYTKDNIRIISVRANRLKSDATLEELKALVKYLEN